MLAVLKNNALICVKEEDLKGHTHISDRLSSY